MRPGVAFLNRVLALVVQLAAFTCTLSRLGEPVGVERTQAHLAQPALGLKRKTQLFVPYLLTWRKRHLPHNISLTFVIVRNAAEILGVSPIIPS
jgi:hypothetical protein